ncbi:MAG: hypothetical protein O7G85_03650, partial [Planctomycetota bacterium]|nr:hypothetical protein [Planctomycetota bacterium]
MGRMAVVALLMGLCLTFASASHQEDEAIAKLNQQGHSIRPLVESNAVKTLLDQVRSLPSITPRTLWFRRDPRSALLPVEYDRLDEDERSTYREMVFDTTRYYETFYGTPIAAMRALDVAADQGSIDSFQGRRILDIGYGSIGQLKLLAQVGADVVGVEVELLLKTLYGFEGDQGSIPNPDGHQGKVRLVHGFWPRDIGEEVGGDFDLIYSKNTLKKGYVTPEQPNARGVDLSVTPDQYLEAIHDSLNPNGLFLIYNIGPGPGPDGHGVDDEGEAIYMHMADIRCPFSQALIDKAGFEVIAFNINDSAMIRTYGHAFGWDDPE